MGAVAYLLRRRCPGVLAALLSYAILQAPNLGLVQHGLMLVADRYAYVATMPLFVVAAGGLVRCVAGARRPMAVAAPIVAVGLGLVAVLAAMSLSLSRTWRDSRGALGRMPWGSARAATRCWRRISASRCMGPVAPMKGSPTSARPSRSIRPRRMHR